MATASDSSTLQAFQYRQLSVDIHETRLIRLLPPLNHTSSQDLPTLRCDLIYVSSNDCPAYIALSYVWGNPTKSSTVVVNGQILHITRNLEIALRQLGEIVESSYLWIDAISINQNDVEEKTSEIQRTFSIYQSATVVLSWLGPAAEDSDNAMQIMNNLGNELLSQGDLQELIVGYRSDKIARIMPFSRIKSEAQSQIQSLVSLFTREYWQRAWIMQELVMSKVLIFVCGQISIRWSLFFAACWFLQTYRVSNGSDMEVEWLRLQDAYAKVNFFIGASYIYKEGRNAPGRTNRLLTFLEVGRQSLRSFDERDMIFSLVALASDWKDLGLKVDYSKSFEEVFMEVALAYLKHGEFGILLQAADAVPRVSGSLPSWVPNWITPRPVTPITSGFSDDYPFSASGMSMDTSFLGGASGQAGHIILAGICVSEVASVGYLLNIDPLKPSFKVSNDWLAEIEELSRSMPQDGCPDEAAWWTPIAFRKPQDGKWRQRSLVLYGAYRALRAMSCFPDRTQRQIALECLQESETYRYAIHRVANNRKAFLSKQGHLGLGPPGVEPGDLICIFLGMEVPLIIRRAPNDSSSYTLIGDAYVYGVMHGELSMDANLIRHFEIQ